MSCRIRSRSDWRNMDRQEEFPRTDWIWLFNPLSLSSTQYKNWLKILGYPLFSGVLETSHIVRSRNCISNASLIPLSHGHFNGDRTQWWLNSMVIGRCYTANFDDHWRRWPSTRWSFAKRHRDARGPARTMHWHPRTRWTTKHQTKTKNLPTENVVESYEASPE